MKKLKKLFVSLLAMLMLFTCAFGITGCGEDIKKLEIKFEVYNYSKGSMETHTLEVDLYRHLAEKTVDKIVEYVDEGYYDNNLVYVMSSFSTQIMFGELVLRDNTIEQNDIKPQIEGEFKHGGTVGSNLKNLKGSIGLWRTWYSFEEGAYKSANATDTGRATCYLPTEAITDYNDYFCVFAKFDLENQNNKNTMNALTNAFSSEENYTSYVIYYTGEYDETQPNNNFGLKFNILEQEEYWDIEYTTDDIFETDAEKEHLVHYNPTTVRIPVINGQFGATIISAKIV